MGTRLAKFGATNLIGYQIQGLFVPRPPTTPPTTAPVFMPSFELGEALVDVETVIVLVVIDDDVIVLVVLVAVLDDVVSSLRV